MQDSGETLFIGVDGGGTGCRVIVGTARAGALAEVSGGRANVATGADLAVENIQKAVNAATLQAGRNPGDLTRAIAHLGLAGVMTPEDAEKVARALPYCQSTVSDDRPTAVTGALDGANGFMVSVGTGTIIASSISEKFSYVGGWGFYVADQASSAWLGHQAFVRVMQCYDGVLEHTDLTRNLLSEFGDDPNAIVAFSVDANPGDWGKFAPSILAAAKSGDTQALGLIEIGAGYLSRGLSALSYEKGDALCLIGGLGRHYAPFLPDKLTSNLIEPKYTAVQGAFNMALRSSGAPKGSGP